MISELSIPTWSQRDNRWSSQRLGTVNETTIGQYGCGITCVAMMNAGFDPGNQLNPAQVDDLFTNQNGYANGNLIIWNAINRILPNCSTQGQIFCVNSPAPVADVKAHLDAGHLAILQVGFGGNPSNMHFVLALGYNGDDIVFNDPWYGDRVSFASHRYGTGQSSTDILAIHYFADGIPPIKPQVPVAARPSEIPLLGYQRVVLSTARVNYRKTPHLNGEVIKQFDPGTVLDFKGYVLNGDVVDDNGAWFVGRYSDGYAHSHAFTDTGYHDLPDLTPAAPTPPPAPAPEPSPQPEPTPEPVAEPTPQVSPQVDKEWITTWDGEVLVTPKVVAVPRADVFDFEAGKVAKSLPGGEPISPIAGIFRVKGVEYVRTQWSVDNGRWNGIASNDLKDLEVPIPVTVVPSPPPTTNDVTPPETNFLDLPAFPDETPEETQRRDLEEVTASITHFLVGILLSPLRLIGKFKKLRKGKE